MQKSGLILSWSRQMWSLKAKLVCVVCVCDRDFVTRSREGGGRGTCRGLKGRERRGKREVCNASMRWVSYRWVDEEQRPEHVSRSSWSTAHPSFPSFNFCFSFLSFLVLVLPLLHLFRSLFFFLHFFLFGISIICDSRKENSSFQIKSMIT